MDSTRRARDFARKVGRRLRYYGRSLTKGDLPLLHPVPKGTLPFLRAFPPGHFFSPVPDLGNIDFGAIEAARNLTSLPGIDLNRDGQLKLLDELTAFYQEVPYLAADAASGLRYRFDNPSFRHADAIVLHCLLRKLRPRRVIEIGCGYSSAVMLDTNERFLDNGTAFDFIDPYPEVLLGLLKQGDEDRVKITRSTLEEVPVATFAELESGDVLFVDSTHVVRTGGDVNRIVFEILPILKPGVFVHIHDIFWPFEYPERWIRQGWAWTEAYLVRAFLTFNETFEIVFFNAYLGLHHRQEVESAMPAFLSDTGGSLWLRKVR